MKWSITLGLCFCDLPLESYFDARTGEERFIQSHDWWFKKKTYIAVI